MSDSDDDIPIALLMKRKMEEKNPGKAAAAAAAAAVAAKKRETVKTTDKKKKRDKPSAAQAPVPVKKVKKTKAVSENEDEAFEDEETKPVVVAKKKRAPVTTTTKRTSAATTPVVNNHVQTMEEDIFGLERMDKHNLVTAILVRWRYCFDWPGELKPMLDKDFIPAHLPGLYVRMSDGKLVDLRPTEDGKTPSMGSLLKLKALDLQTMLVSGLKKQIALATNDVDLREHLERELEKAEKLKVKKIERKYQEALGNTSVKNGTAADAKEEDD